MGIKDNERVVRKVVREEIMTALKMIIGGKAAGVDSIFVGMSESGSISTIYWLLRIFNRCMEYGVVPEDLKATYCPIYKGKGDRRDYANYRRISILSIPRKIYERALISRAVCFIKGNLTIFISNLH